MNTTILFISRLSLILLLHTDYIKIVWVTDWLHTEMVYPFL